MDENAQDERIEIGEPPGMIEGGYVVQGFDPTRAGELVKATDKRTRRWFLHKTAVIGGGAFAVGLAVKLGLNEHEAIAVTCSCCHHQELKRLSIRDNRFAALGRRDNRVHRDSERLEPRSRHIGAA
jgi:hypothetical protein